VYIMIVEGVITFIIVASLFYVAPGVLAAVQAAAPVVTATGNESTAAAAGMIYNPTLAASQTSINTIVAGGLNLSAIAMIMLGIGLMIGGFMLVRGGGGNV
jgi:hypothetical protein